MTASYTSGIDSSSILSSLCLQAVRKMSDQKKLEGTLEYKSV